MAKPQDLMHSPFLGHSKTQLDLISNLGENRRFEFPLPGSMRDSGLFLISGECPGSFPGVPLFDGPAEVAPQYFCLHRFAEHQHVLIRCHLTMGHDM